MSKDNFPPGGRVPRSGKYECVCCGPAGLAVSFQSIAAIAHAGQPVNARQPLNVALVALANLPKSIQVFQEGTTFPSCPNCKKLLPAGMDLTGWNLIEELPASPAPAPALPSPARTDPSRKASEPGPPAQPPQIEPKTTTGAWICWMLLMIVLIGGLGLATYTVLLPFLGEQ